MATAHLRAVLEGFDQAKRELADVGKQVDDLGSKKINVGESANEGTAAIKGLGEASALTSKELALVGAASAAVAAAGVYATKVLYDEIRATADLADTYNELRQTTGLQVETLSSMTLAFQTNGITVEAGAKIIERFNKNLYDAQNGNKETARTFAALGIDAKRFGDDTEGALLAVAERFSKMEDGAGKTALAMELFGRGGAKLIPFLNEGASGLAKLREEARLAGLVMSSETAKAGDELNDALAVLNGHVRGFWQELSTPFVVGMADIARSMRGARVEGEGLFGVLAAGAVTLARLSLFGSERGQLDDVTQRLKDVRASIGRHMASGDTGALRQAEAEEAALVGDQRRLTAFLDPTLNNTPREAAPSLPDKEGGRTGKSQEQKELEAAAALDLKRYTMQEARFLAEEDRLTKEYEKELQATATMELKRFAIQEKAYQQQEEAATKAFEKRQKESEKAAAAEIKDIAAVTEMYRGDKVRALEELERKYRDMGMEGAEALKKVQEAIKDANAENAKLIAGATSLKSALGQLGFDTAAIIQGTMRSAQKEVSELLKGHQSLGDAARNIWRSIGNTAIDELSRVIVNEGWKALVSFFKGEGVNLSWISSAFSSITSNFGGVIDALSSGFNSLLSIGTSVFDSVAELFSGGGGGFGDLFSGGGGDDFGFGDAASLASLAANIASGNWIGAALSLFGGGGGGGGFLGDVFGGIGDIFGGFFATGTDQMVTSPKLVMVGENGPERLQVTPMAGGGVGGRSAVMNFYGPTMMGNYEMSRMKRELARI